LPPDFLAIGHVTRDLVDDETRDGGTATYAAAVAARLGLRAAILTSAGEEYTPPLALAGVEVHRLPAPRTTIFRHVWHGRRREMSVLQQAAPITAADVPATLRGARIVLLGPVCGEVDAGVAAAFPGALRGAALQGWLRRLASDGRVEPIDAAAWPAEAVLAGVDAAFLSDEDLGAGDVSSVLARWAALVPVLAVTAGAGGARIAVKGRWQRIAAFPAVEIDATGAGDTFAATFLIRYHETGDAAAAARFAAAAAACVVEAPGIAGAPTRAQVEARLAAAPRLCLQPEGA
jgi:1D-myo-inositol 3-kinase